MRPDAIARRYARALFSLSNEQKSLDAVGSALATTTDVLTEPSVMRVLTGPLSRERKRALLLKIVATTNTIAIDAITAPILCRLISPKMYSALDARVCAALGICPVEIADA